MRCRNTTITYQSPTQSPFPPPLHTPHTNTQLHCALLCSLTLQQLFCSHSLELTLFLCVWGWRWQKFMLRTKVKQTQKSKRFAALATPTTAVGGASERALSCNIRASKMPDSNNKNRVSEREQEHKRDNCDDDTLSVCVCVNVCKRRTNIVKRVGSWHLNGRHLFSARAWHTHTHSGIVCICVSVWIEVAFVVAFPV